MTLRQREYLSEAKSGKPYSSYMVDGEELFLKAAIRPIKKIAGGKLEKLGTERKRSLVMLSYEGQDSSDMDLKVHFHLITNYPDVTLSIFGKSVQMGSISKSIKKKVGELTPDFIVQEFRLYFRSHG